MVDTWIVFGGWGTDPRICAPLFGRGARFIASDTCMPRLIRGGKIAHEWPRVLLDLAARELPARPFGIAGWSVGAMLAYALAGEVEPAVCVFISATPSFCRRPEFPYGQKPLVLKAMRERLAVDPAGVLETFHARCGIGPCASVSENTGASRGPDRDALIDGLYFLEQASLLPVRTLPCPSMFLHGKGDAIVPLEAGKRFCSQAGGVFAEYEGPHAFFMARYGEVAAFIRERAESACQTVTVASNLRGSRKDIA